MKRQNALTQISLFFLSLVLIVSCNTGNDSPTGSSGNEANGEPVVMGYSNWAGWWPWAIAEEEGLFEKNGANVRLQWFDGYLASMEAMAAGQLDANCQTLNDTVSFVADAVNGEVVVLVNDNSAGNDKIIAAEEIRSIPDLEGKDVAVEAGVVDDFLLTLALEEEGMSRSDVNIVDLETGAAAAAFASGKVDAVGAFPPYWLTALKREGSHELVTSAEFPGAIPDLLVTSQDLIDNRPNQVQALVDTWFDVLEFMENNPDRADEIMAQRADVTTEELQLFKEGTKIFTLEENLEAFSEGNNMTHMPYAAEEMAAFMVNVGFIPEKPDLSSLFNDSFVKTYAEKQ
ncbi:ABC transporter substrate-binding protein [Dactylococcopsis salina]|uniref:ABC transporter, substrate-binding protein, aliphatic sulfonates family n=1 Tax=Dactylococcopsis salina (strain PCC 8305) TaxID=13035 RepID=K9YYK1_DACS8|nr:ABC transporter substrate-binding protein [Dactylococcopsis salina]AFZ52031.1 ABC transporter, substrate-binding protein, aliphatic sulfonates family [Dactylococcopsis salina PCC 8305]